MKTKILKRLKSSDSFVSGEKLSEEFGMTRSGIWKYMNQIKEDGYIIESVPRKGYRILFSPDILTLEEIEEHLTTNFIGRKIYYFESIDSTNDKAKIIAVDEEEGTVVIAEEQTGGKGRLGRKWISPKGKGIWMSIILKPSVEPFKVGSITLLGAAAIFKGLENMGISSKIKWPNDIIIDDKKISGILTEMSAELNRINHLIMGIGINVNLDQVDIPEDLKDKATSLKINGDRKIDRKVLLAHILNEFEKLYIPFRENGDTSIAIDICKKNSATVGNEVKIIRGKEEKLGRAIDIDEKGQLIVEFKDGKIENIFSGEVSVRGVNGYI